MNGQRRYALYTSSRKVLFLIYPQYFLNERCTFYGLLKKSLDVIVFLCQCIIRFVIIFIEPDIESVENFDSSCFFDKSHAVDLDKKSTISEWGI